MDFIWYHYSNEGGIEMASEENVVQLSQPIKLVRCPRCHKPHRLPPPSQHQPTHRRTVVSANGCRTDIYTQDVVCTCSACGHSWNHQHVILKDRPSPQEQTSGG
ncbi:MAG TPA: hypothetical protein VK963_01670 [Candidatus Saccharimonadales bacterium]|nr:hypothetical protein [Candidatus Saccharimonadales bacterium]